MSDVACLKESLGQLEVQIGNAASAASSLSQQTMDVNEIQGSLDELIDTLSEQVITEELSEKLNLYVKDKYKPELDGFRGSESARKALWEDLLGRAMEELGLISNLETELKESGLPLIQERLEDLDRMKKKVEHMFNDCNKLMESIEGNLSNLQSKLPAGQILYVPYSTESNPIVLDDDEKVDLDECDDDEDVVAISPNEKTHPGSGGRASYAEKPARKFLTPQEVMEEVVVPDLTHILARRGEVWHAGKVLDIVPAQRTDSMDIPIPSGTSPSQPGFYNSSTGRQFRVKFNGGGSRIVNGQEIALSESAADRNEIYPVGTRVVSVYRDEEGTEDFYSGIVAEPPSERNNKRYLLFFDDGYTQYSKEEEIFRIILQTTRNWMKLSEDSQEFVKKYLENYPNRPMVRLKTGMTVRTELNCKWLPATVEEVDASLVLIRFNSDSHREWIYRGSTRLEPLYSEIRKMETAQKMKPHAQRKLDSGVPNKPVVEYLHDRTKLQRPTARKSSAGIRRSDGTTVPGLNREGDQDLSTIFVSDNMAEEIENRGAIQPTITKIQEPKPFKAHECSHSCLGVAADSRDTFKGWNPLEIPILWGWARCRMRAYPRGGCRDYISYVAPCGRRLRSMGEVERYLDDTNSNLTLDLFCFDSVIRINAEFKVHRAFTNIVDLSYGAENVPVPCVNSVDNEVPPYVDYHRDRISRHTPLCEDPNFLPGCSCEDNCKDRSKCSCQQLTIHMSACRRGGSMDMRSGYTNRKLLHHYVTGVFECNSNCRCDSRCKNRVVQNGLWVKLQIFKTEKKGWGIRTLHDIPKGMFICIYAGMMYGEQLAVDEGNEFGDEYQADLDYIECVENGKEGYESDVEEPSDTEEGTGNNVSPLSSNSSVQDSDSGAESDFHVNAGGGDTALERRTLPQRSVKQRRKEMTEEEEPPPRPSVPKPDPSRALIGRLVPSPTKNEPAQLSAEIIVISDEEDSTEQSTNKEKKRTGGRRSTRGGGGLSSSAGTKCPTLEDSSAVKCRSLRELYGDGHTQPYIMDAKKAGNLGRYMNHSCSPNAFVQNVFITTHDARFPEVAFFACKNIMAGEELTWDYQYQVSSVPNKELYCYCGTAECRGRLL